MTELPKTTLPLLEKWNGGKAKLWFYSVSLNKLIVRIEKEEIHGNLHIIFSPCLFIMAPTVWTNCKLEIFIIEKDQVLGATFCLQDLTNDVKIKGRGIYFEENVDPVF